jgi:epoxyqueuosine reductase
VNGSTLSAAIKEKALFLGASLAGIASVDAVLRSPSHGDGSQFQRRFQQGSFIVMALVHSAGNPSLDWWDGRGGTPGNRELQRISKRLQHWLKVDCEITSRIIPYQVQRGGIYLKEAAVIAGMGIIGKNNLLITPRYGAGVRLRALFLEKSLPSDQPSEFAPCDDCPAPCQAACPQHAFQGGGYDRNRCLRQLLQDETNRTRLDPGRSVRSVVMYCRACEWACPVCGDA